MVSQRLADQRLADQRNGVEAPKSLSEGGNWSRCELPRFPPPLWVYVRRVFSPGLAVAVWLSAFLCFPGGGEGTSLPCGPHSSVATSRWQVLIQGVCSAPVPWAQDLSKTLAVTGVDIWPLGSPSLLCFINQLCLRCSSLTLRVHIIDAQVRGGWLP